MKEKKTKRKRKCLSIFFEQKREAQKKLKEITVKTHTSRGERHTHG